jgi:hypothetical protein
MIKATSSVLAVVMAAGLAVAGSAGAREHGVNERQGQQRERVAAGVHSGEVTRQESRALHHDAQRIERNEQAYRLDGHFSGAERREVHRDLDRHGRQIHQARNDQDGRGGQNAPGWHGGREWSHGRSGIDGVQQRQHEQIREGVRSGSLTPQEARRLGGEQRQIAALERGYRADGVLTRYERRDLNGELRDAGRHIYNQSHDADVSYRQ